MRQLLPLLLVALGGSPPVGTVALGQDSPTTVNVEQLDAPYWPHDVPNEGSRPLPFSRTVYIDRDDFLELCKAMQKSGHPVGFTPRVRRPHFEHGPASICLPPHWIRNVSFCRLVED